MKKIVKKIIKLLIPYRLRRRISISKENMNIYDRNYDRKGKLKKIICLAKYFFKIKICFSKYNEIEVMKKCKINLYNNNTFISSLDEMIFKDVRKIFVCNSTIDYKKFLDTTLEDMIKKYSKCENEHVKMEYQFLLSINEFLDRMIVNIEKSDLENKDKFILNLKAIKNSKDLSFEQQLQKILFLNSIAWQTNIRLNGLGRLDKVLDKKYDFKDENNKDLIYQFLDILHKKYNYKSSLLLGDTGQIIVLGGIEKDDTYFCNDLTYMFIEQLGKINVPDPKILLRVSSKMPKDLMEVSLNCIKKGIGSPLFSNDDVIIPLLKKYGYNDDAYDYVTAACWEPLIPGKSLDHNNLGSINFAIPFNKAIDNNISNIEELMDIYKVELRNYLEKIIDVINNYKFENNLLFSLFTDDCYLKDIAEGAAPYNNFGFTSVGLSSVVNSILNIEDICFTKKIYSLDYLSKEKNNNFNDEKILKVLKSNQFKYGLNDKRVIKLTNDIVDYVDSIFEKKKNQFNGKYRFGLSSPSYLTEGKNTLATLDGRKNCEPFNTHISSDYPFDETISFATKINYEDNCINGNVIDFMITPDYINNNFIKFRDYLFNAIREGFFQMQMNVVSSKILIEAKKNPELYPNLIVRVWGFSAYFNDLPEEYKQILIERALKNEQ